MCLGHQAMTTGRDWLLTGGQVLGEDGLQPMDLALEDGVIASRAPRGAQGFDARGLWLLPGIVDVHGDAIERIIMPRPDVTFALPLALAEADRQMLANGITTAYHGLTISWEPGLRSLDAARDFVAAIEAGGKDLACDTRINFRWETHALDAVDDVQAWLTRHPGSILSFNDHTTPLVGLPPQTRKIRRMAERIGLTPEDCAKALADVATRAPEVPGAVNRLAKVAIGNAITLFAHDETSPEMRAENRALGITVSEFPMTEATAHAARLADERVVFGAPNVLRGGSQNDAVDAAPAIRAGLGTVLATDYYYPAPLRAAFILARDHGVPFAAAWDCVSANAAAAAGLGDRGRLRPGQRADVIAVCPQTCTVKAVFVAGERKLGLA